ncbi:MAG: SDR family oxidoreductase [Alphaproteobacteria bacterium]|nr:SDR family oxidoreductase [Alphaproteobacteria bacterium]
MKGALVTGAARRIGRAIATSLAREGWHIAVHYNTSSAQAGDLVADIEAAGGQASVVRADLADPSACIRLIEDAAQLTGGLGCLVNNASAFVEDDIRTVEAAGFDSLMAVNLRAPVLLSKAFAAQVPQGGEAVIVNILDQKLDNPNPDFLSYTLSKYGLAGLTEMLAMALGPSVRVCAVSPGLTLPSGEQAVSQFESVHRRTPLARGSDPDDVADAVCYLTRARAVTGETILVDGGQHLVPSSRDVMFLDPSHEEDSGE